MSSLQALRQRLADFPRTILSDLPTPLEALPRLSARLPGVSLFIKRDDETGLAFGGNKARKLEFIVGDMEARGADTMVTWAGVQSNWCRQVAAALARVGRKAVLILLRKPGMPVGEDGNLLLDRLLGAEIRIVSASGDRGFLELQDVEDLVLPVVEELRSAGRRTYLVPVGGSLLEGDMNRPLGTMGYVLGFAELLEQARERGFTPDTVVLATGSAGTQAGLLAGACLLSPTTRIVGISVAGAAPTVRRHVAELATAALRELGGEAEIGDEQVIVMDEYLAEGYGVMNRTVSDAITLLARDEGVLLDPVYTGKSMAALMDLAGKEFFREGEKVVFLHTGGTPALFPYREGILSGLPG